MVDGFNEDRAREWTVECLRGAGSTLHCNREMCIQILMDMMGAPDERVAGDFLDRMILLLGIVSGKVSIGKILDASTKPTVHSTEVH
jgi:hypothetical protein